MAIMVVRANVALHRRGKERTRISMGASNNLLGSGMVRASSISAAWRRFTSAALTPRGGSYQPSPGRFKNRNENQNGKRIKYIVSAHSSSLSIA
jgi:hypothetical protein